jgi:hypothetical protein
MAKTREIGQKIVREVLCPAHTDISCGNRPASSLMARRSFPKCPGNLPEHPAIRQPGAASVPAVGSSELLNRNERLATSCPELTLESRIFGITQSIEFT